MSLLSCAYVLLARPMQRRFESDPLFQATLLLLQERIPRAHSFHIHATHGSPNAARPQRAGPAGARAHHAGHARFRKCSCCRTAAITSWSPMRAVAAADGRTWPSRAGAKTARRDNWGTFCYLRDATSGDVLVDRASADAQRGRSLRGHILRGAGGVPPPRSRFRHAYRDRRLAGRRHRGAPGPHHQPLAHRPAAIDVTSYAEVVLASAAATRCIPRSATSSCRPRSFAERNAIICTRRPRSREEQVPWMFHLMTVAGRRRPRRCRSRPIACDSSAAAARWPRHAAMMDARRTVRTPTARCSIRSLRFDGGSPSPLARRRSSTSSRASPTAAKPCCSSSTSTRIGRLADRAFELTWTHSQVVLRQLNATEADSQLYARLASSRHLRQRFDARCTRPFWSAIAAANRVCGATRSPATCRSSCCRSPSRRQHRAGAPARPGACLLAPEGTRGRPGDLERGSRRAIGSVLQEQIIGLIAAGVEAHVVDRPGGIFVRHAEQISAEDRMLFQTVARAIISDSRGRWRSRSTAAWRPTCASPRLVPTRSYRPEAPADTESRPRGSHALQRHGRVLGGRARIRHRAGSLARATPAPWVNVIANPTFGTVVSESGLGYTWSENAHQFRLTPWHNDPVSESERRGAVSPRRRDRALLVAHALALRGRRAPSSPDMDSATAFSSTSKTASAPSSPCSWRSTPASSSIRC